MRLQITSQLMSSKKKIKQKEIKNEFLNLFQQGFTIILR